MPTIRRILSPVDFSETSEHALRYAIELATKLGADVQVVHAYQLPVYALPDGAVMATPDFLAKLTSDLDKELHDLVRRYAGHGVTLESHLVQGQPHLEVNRLAKKLGADMIVMGTHGRTGITRFLLGSVAERVVRTAEVPVLTVHGEEK